MDATWRLRHKRTSDVHRRERGAPLNEILLSTWRVHLSPLRIAELRERHRAGATTEELAREVGCSVATMKLALG